MNSAKIPYIHCNLSRVCVRNRGKVYSAKRNCIALPNSEGKSSLCYGLCYSIQKMGPVWRDISSRLVVYETNRASKRVCIVHDL